MIRPAASADLPGVRAVAGRYQLLELWPPGAPDFLAAELAYGRLGVAAVDGAVTGFSGTLPRGRLTHLGDLFVLPGAQSAGLGRALLEYALAEAGPVVTFASADPRAMALYLRAGLVPRCPLLYLSGRLASADQTRDTPGPRAGDGDLPLAIELDAVASGGRRAELLRWYAGVPGVRVHTVGDSYAFTRAVADQLVLGPAGGVPAVEAALGAAGGRELRLALFGTHPLLPRLIRAGLRIEDLDTFMSTDPDLIRLDSYLPSTDLG